MAAEKEDEAPIIKVFIVSSTNDNNTENLIHLVKSLNIYFWGSIALEYSIGRGGTAALSEEFQQYVASTGLYSVSDYDTKVFFDKHCNSIPPWHFDSLNEDYNVSKGYVRKTIINNSTFLLYPKSHNVWKLLQPFFKEVYSTPQEIASFNSKFRDIKIDVNTKACKVGFDNKHLQT